jgi:hypothetical protein
MGTQPWFVLVALAALGAPALAQGIPGQPVTVEMGDMAPIAGQGPVWTTGPQGEVIAPGQPNYVVKIVDPQLGMPMEDSAECGSCCLQRCHPARWEHDFSLFADFLYLTARNADVAYGVPIDGPIVGPPPASPIQIGRTGMVEPGYNPGFRIGGSFPLNSPANIRAQWTHWSSDDTDSISTTAPNVIRSLVSHPESQSAATNFLRATSSTDIGFDLADVDYRGPIMCGKYYYVNYLLGGRYANLDQDFSATFSNLGSETVRTDINFNGGGIRLGLEGERYARHSGWKIYGRGAASFVAGTFDGSYTQSQTFDPTVVHTDISVGRIVPILDLEIGAGWSGPAGHWHFTAGYLVSAWMNVVKTSEFIKGVQQNDVSNLSDTLTFDGLVARAEYRW